MVALRSNVKVKLSSEYVNACTYLYCKCVRVPDLLGSGSWQRLSNVKRHNVDGLVNVLKHAYKTIQQTMTCMV